MRGVSLFGSRPGDGKTSVSRRMVPSIVALLHFWRRYWRRFDEGDATIGARPRGDWWLASGIDLLTEGVRERHSDTEPQIAATNWPQLLPKGSAHEYQSIMR